MKKLMIAAAIVCAAAFAQAGSVQWKSQYLNPFGQEGDVDPVEGVTVYLMNAGSTTQTAFLKALVDAGDNWQTEFGTQVAGAFNSATQGEKKLTNPKVGEVDGNTVIQDVGSAASEALYMVMLDSANSAVYVSELVSKPIDDMGATPFSFTHGGAADGNVFKAADGYSDGGYYTFGAVPEPTSGLLLLLGVAGLALRRRRA